MPRPAERITIAPGLTISRVLTGLWQIADLERSGRLDPHTTAPAMAPYVEAGLTTFDMADHYGSAEEIAGAFRTTHALGRSIQTLTKWVPKPGPVSPADVRAAVRRALDRLRVDRLELLQFHCWTYADPAWLDALLGLQALKSEGLVGHIGVTNMDTAHLRVAVKSGIEIASNQVCYSLLDRRAGGAMTAFCVEHGISLLAFGSVAGGFFSERWLGQPEPDWESLETWSLLKYGRFIKEAGGWAPFQTLLRALDGIARRYEASMANVACRYILDQPAVGGVIIGARLGRSEHLAENLRVFDVSLDARASAALDAALVGLSPIRGDCGDEYRRPPYLTASGDLSHHLDNFPAPYPVVPTAHGDRQLVFSGTKWETLAGYSRAVREGNRVWVSGTTSTHGTRVIGGTDAAAQAHFAIDKIEGALHSVGARLEDVVRTRVYVPNLAADWEPISRAHGERFAAIRPANTLVQGGLVGTQYLVEIEADAVISD